MSDQSTDPVEILSVSFGDRWIEISWHDASDESQRSLQYHQDHIDPTLVGEQLAEVLENVREMLTIAAIYRRDPPKTFTRGA